MGLDIWFKDDIANILRAADEANLSALVAGEGVSGAGDGEPATELRCAYRHGFVAALMTLALAFGLPPLGMDRPFATEGPETRRGSEGRPLALPLNLVGGKRWEE